MKHWRLNILFTLVVLTSSVSAQVNFEHIYPWGINVSEWFLTDLGNSNYKYVIHNHDSSSFSMYNLNHTPFMMNIPIPVQDDPPTNTYYRLGYVTTTLFDCDSTNIEYAMMLNTPNYTHFPNTAVYRTDGTVIFSKDSVGTMMCYGCGSGSYEIRPIMNTSAGAKLYLFNQDGILVYSLCGTLPTELTEIEQSSEYVKVYPNPSSHNINFELTLPSNYEDYELIIFNSDFQTIKTSKVRGIKTSMNLNSELLSSGTYFYSLQNKYKLFQNGKFIIAR